MVHLPHFIGRRTSAKGSQFFHRRLTVIIYLIFHARSSTEVSTPARLADGTNAARHSFPKSPTNRCAVHRRCSGRLLRQALFFLSGRASARFRFLSAGSCFRSRSLIHKPHTASHPSPALTSPLQSETRTKIW